MDLPDSNCGAAFLVSVVLTQVAASGLVRGEFSVTC